MSDERDASIIRQVAFKGAIEAIMRSPTEFKSFEEIAAFVAAATDRFEAIINKRNGLVAAAKAAGAVEKPAVTFCNVCGKKLVLKEGVSKKTDMPWKGWFCPDRNCKGKPVWVKDQPENMPEDGEIPFE